MNGAHKIHATVKRQDTQDALNGKQAGCERYMKWKNGETHKVLEMVKMRDRGDTLYDKAARRIFLPEAATRATMHTQDMSRKKCRSL